MLIPMKSNENLDLNYTRSMDIRRKLASGFTKASYRHGKFETTESRMGLMRQNILSPAWFPVNTPHHREICLEYIIVGRWRLRKCMILSQRLWRRRLRKCLSPTTHATLLAMMATLRKAQWGTPLPGMSRSTDQKSARAWPSIERAELRKFKRICCVTSVLRSLQWRRDAWPDLHRPMNSAFFKSLSANQ